MRLSTLMLALCLCSAAAAQQSPVPDAAPAAEASPAVFPHPDAARYLVSGQANIIFQAHAPFHSPYSGSNSLLSRGEYKPSLLGTVYLAYQLNPHLRYATDAILDVESSGGRGISEALGLAGFTNLDVVRNPSLGSKPYLARYQLHQVVGFTSTLADSQRTPFSLATKLPTRRLDLHIGRMSLPDFFDINAIASDSHLQFLNWTADNSGAWDYAANTRGYTDAAVAELVFDDFTLRYGLAAMPTVANGVDLQYNFHRANGQNVEFEDRNGPLHPFLPKHPGVVRLLGFVNKANMGNYRAQNQAALATGTTPVITAHTFGSSYKYGVGFNFEQELTPALRTYGRFGWNEGQHESYAYTEVDQTIAFGADYKPFTRRPNDKLGATFITNAIKRDHQYYLAHGGLGFLIGDGRLNYGREDILESYYNLHGRPRHLLCARRPVHYSPRLQPGPRAGAGRVGPDARRLLAALFRLVTRD